MAIVEGLKARFGFGKMTNRSFHTLLKPTSESRRVSPDELGLRYLDRIGPSSGLHSADSGWALQKQYVRRFAPREAKALRRVARRARNRVTQTHCRKWFAHCG